MTAVIVVPPPGGLTIVSVPFIAAARSRSPSKPVDVPSQAPPIPPSPLSRSA